MNVGQHMLAPGNAANAHAGYVELHRRGSLFYDAEVRYWIVSGYRAIRTALIDQHFGVRAPTTPSASSDPLSTLRREMFLFLDSPRHQHLRGLTAAAFHRRRVDALQPLITEVAGDCIDRVRRGETDDIVDGLATFLPVRIIAEILGLPLSQLPALQRWSNSLTSQLLEPMRPTGAAAAAAHGFSELSEFLRDLFRHRRRRPRGDLVTRLVADCDAGILTPGELLSTCVLLLLAGHETTANLIGTAIYNLARFPQQRRRIARQPALIDSAVEELLRFDSPVQATRRFVHSDTAIDGVSLPAGERLLLLLGSANHDPEIFERPHLLDVGRQPNRHLAFAPGGHACLGAALARLETKIVLTELLRSMPHYEVDEESVRWKTSSNLRGLHSLRLRR